MKRNILAVTAFTLLTGSILFTSCKKDDITDPVVTLVGTDMTVSLQGTYTDPGATADDNKDGKITPTTSGSVNTNLTGVYEITYTATDAAGNSASVTRNVTVKNDADGINGTYNVAGTQTAGGTQTYTYVQTIMASTTRNNRIIFGKLGDYAGNTNIYADIVGNSSIDMPSQTAIMVGTNPAANRTFQGTGNKSGNTLTLTYTEVTTGGGGTFQEIMTKQ
jgi:hypothetical protein